MRVANFASSGRKFTCRGFRAFADAGGAPEAKIIVPRSCLGTPCGSAWPCADTTAREPDPRGLGSG